VHLFFLNRKSAIKNLKSLNDFVRPHQRIRRNRQADLVGGFQINDQLKLYRLLNKKISGLGDR